MIKRLHPNAHVVGLDPDSEGPRLANGPLSRAHCYDSNHSRPVLSLLALTSFLQSLDLDLAHLKYGLHHALRLRVVLIIQHVAEHRRNDLPGNAELIFEPAASSFLAVRSEPFPMVIDFTS